MVDHEKADAKRYRNAPTDLPPVTQPASFGVTDSQSGTNYGSLVHVNNAWTTSTINPPSPLTYTASPSWTLRDEQRLTHGTPSPDDPYPVFGLGQCSPGGPTTIGSGTANVLCLVSAASSALPGNPPTLLANNLDITSTLLARATPKRMSYVSFPICYRKYAQEHSL